MITEIEIQTIAGEIQRIKNNIANTYTVLEGKGATLPETLNSANLSTCAESVPSGGGGSSYTGYRNFVPLNECIINSSGISTQGGFMLDCMYNSNATNKPDKGSYLNYFLPIYTAIGVRVRFKPNEINKDQVITGTRVCTSTGYVDYGVSFVLSSDNSTITAYTNSKTVTGTLLNTATAQNFIDVILIGYYNGDWVLELFQTTDLMQTWTSISSIVSGKIGISNDDAFGCKLSELSFGYGYSKGSYFNFNGEIDTLNSGVYSMYGSEYINMYYPICQNSPIIVYKHHDNTNFSITNNVASGFDLEPLACIGCTKIFEPQGNNWERGIKITTSSDVTTEQWMFGSTYDTMGYGLAIKNGNLFHFAGTGSGWFISGGVGSIPLSANTSYYIKTTCLYDGDVYQYTTYVSTDKETWTQDYYDYNSRNISSQPTLIGMHASFDIPFLGSIDLSETYWSINNVEQWRGTIV